VSATLKANNPDQGCRSWAFDFVEAGALLSAIVRVAHPDLYDAGLIAFMEMHNIPEVAECLQCWSSIFSAISVIANRESPIHRDAGTRSEWYDFLVSIGGDPDTRMVWPSLGVQLAYTSGTGVLFSGYCIPHGVGKSKADRVCIAGYMKDNVHERFHVRAPGWMNIEMYDNVD